MTSVLAPVLIADTAQAGAAGAAAGVPFQPDWTVGGQNTHNTRNALGERILGSSNVARLTPRWILTAGDNVVATPTVARGVVYVPDQAGNLWAVDAASGRVIWSKKVGDYTGVAGDVSRNSPAIYGDTLVIGTATPGVGGYELGIDARTGALRWRTQVDTNPYTRMTGSPVVDQGVVYVGVSSTESFAPDNFTFRGSVVALNAQTGTILWKTYTVPLGYTGGAVWGTTPVVDRKRGLVYVGTGQNYTVPDGVCKTPIETGCQEPATDDYLDSVLGLDMRTGAVVWARKTLTADAWTVGSQLGPDYDFGSGPNLYTTLVNGKPTDLVGVGQKSGIYWALNPDTGEVAWKTKVGPGGSVGGIVWGSATDGRRVFAAISNFFHEPYTITLPNGQPSTINGGSWAALDAGTGAIIWQTPDPQGAPDLGFVSTANGVVYAGSVAGSGNNMYALDACTGAIKWSFASGGSVVSGAAVVNGSVYWGSGHYIPGTTPNNKLFAFSLPGRN